MDILVFFRGEPWFTFWWVWRTRTNSTCVSFMVACPSMLTARILVSALVLALAMPAVASAGDGEPTRTSQQLKRDVLINADMWDRRPRMMAAGLGFTNILGVPGLATNDPVAAEQAVRAAGGAWNKLQCATEPAIGDHTSAATPNGMAFGYGYPAYFGSGLPVEFSWPVLPSTVDPTDFRLTMSDGSKVTPQLAALYPNYEYNERGVVVLVGPFGNRLPAGFPGALYVTKTEVVRDSTPLKLVGPRGRTVSAVGMSATASTSPYGNPNAPAGERTGPRLAAAKLNRMSTRGESAPPAFRNFLPNDGVTLYGRAAKYRVRVYTTGGFSPDGVLGVKPTEYERYFRLRARGRNGREILITKVGRRYRINGGTLRVVGLADLGRKQDTYDDCYAEDHDNQIDIIIDGDRRAVERITHVELPGTGRYDPMYNPGGPGNDPTPGVRYTVGSPTIKQKVINALDNPMTVTYTGRR
jgi:hypothetical protein